MSKEVIGMLRSLLPKLNRSGMIKSALGCEEPVDTEFSDIIAHGIAEILRLDAEVVQLKEYYQAAAQDYDDLATQAQRERKKQSR